MVGYLAQAMSRMYLIVSDMAFAYWARYPHGTEDLAQGELQKPWLRKNGAWSMARVLLMFRRTGLSMKYEKHAVTCRNDIVVCSHAAGGAGK